MMYRITVKNKTTNTEITFKYDGKRWIQVIDTHLEILIQEIPDNE